MSGKKTPGSSFTTGLRFILLLVVLASSTGCATGGRSGQPTLPASTAWPQAYRDAIADALDPEPGEIVTNLVAIVRSNPVLTWRTFPDGDRVLMVSLVENPSDYPTAPDARYDTGTTDIWVTAVPEVRTRCTQPGFDRGNLVLRLNQLLGLPLSYASAAFVELWVQPSQMFRPAPDNEITDTTAGLTMPDTTDAWYRKWFNEQRAKVYFQSASPPNDAYPWTQLGYTYDWGSPTHQGPSEFVIRQHSEVFVHTVTTYETYCSTR